MLLITKCLVIDVSSHLFDVKTKSSTHEGWQLNKKHVPAKVVECMGDCQRPKRNREGNVFPGNWRTLGLDKRNNQNNFVLSKTLDLHNIRYDVTDTCMLTL